MGAMAAVRTAFRERKEKSVQCCPNEVGMVEGKVVVSEETTMSYFPVLCSRTSAKGLFRRFSA